MKIKVTSYHPIAVDKTAQLPYSDVWLLFECNGVQQELAATLHSRTSLINDIESDKEILDENKSHKFINGKLTLTEAPLPDALREDFLQMLKRNENILSVLTENFRFFSTERQIDNYNVIDIYTHSDYIDRAEAEKMCKSYIIKKYGFSDIKTEFQWLNLGCTSDGSQLIVTPTII